MLRALKVLEWLGNSDSETVAAARLKDLFFAFDSDGGGCLDVSELMAGLQSFDIYLTRAQIVGLMPGVDANNDSAVSSRRRSQTSKEAHNTASTAFWLAVDSMTTTRGLFPTSNSNYPPTPSSVVACLP